MTRRTPVTEQRGSVPYCVTRRADQSMRGLRVLSTAGACRFCRRAVPSRAISRGRCVRGRTVLPLPRARRASGWSHRAFPRAVSLPDAAPNTAENVCLGTPSQSAQVPYSRVSSTSVSPTSNTTASITWLSYVGGATKVCRTSQGGYWTISSRACSLPPR